MRGRVVEVEVYSGWKDKASHARFGRTRRNKVMFGPPGYSYVYLVYGMYYMLNVVTGREGFPAAVLIRALDIETCSPLLAGRGKTDLERSLPRERSRGRELKKVDNRLAAGPGKVGRYLKLTGAHNGLDMINGDVLWLEQGFRLPGETVIARPRIGIDYAEEYRDKLWRFYLAGNPAVSNQ